MLKKKFHKKLLNGEIMKKHIATTLDRLEQGNKTYLTALYNNGNISKEQREHTDTHGQTPYAVVVTCSDSRVTPEHIFNVGIGELFVIRNAGNIIQEIELGSIEYGVVHLQADTIIVMGHTNCGAVTATINGHTHGNIRKIIDIIKEAIGNETDIVKATIANVENSILQILTSPCIQKLLKENKVEIKGALYNSKTGKVDFL